MKHSSVVWITTEVAAIDGDDNDDDVDDDKHYVARTDALSSSFSSSSIGYVARQPTNQGGDRMLPQRTR